MTADLEPTVSVIVPTFNESPNVAELVARVCAALGGSHRGTGRVEIIFVDDSTDDTPSAIQRGAARWRGRGRNPGGHRHLVRGDGRRPAAPAGDDLGAGAAGRIQRRGRRR